MNLGVDFGSTYSIFSTYRKEQNRLEVMTDRVHGSADIPSIIAIDTMDPETKPEFGRDAKDQTGDEDIRTFKAFKMLLTEANQDFVKARQYDDRYSPRWATQEFLRYEISEAMSQQNATEVENLVIGAPDVWFHSFNSLSGRALLRDLCTDIEGVRAENIRIVSEPVLASAYFAYNFATKTHRPFEGCILIIDYGGGTLDLSLTKVSRGENNSMEIRMLESNGAGENTNHSVGNAGIIYMESLMEHVLRKNNPEEAEDIIGTSDFYKAVDDLEKQLMRETDAIEDNFTQLDLDFPEFLEDEKMTKQIRCCGRKYNVTYADLLQVYQDKIQTVFGQKMEQMIEWAKEKDGIDLLVSNGDVLKIALVGGFSNFYLVRNQMEQKFNFNTQDERAHDIIDTVNDRERAISYGAALIASGQIGIRNTAPYSIGILSKSPDGKEEINYMVQYREEIKIGEPCYIKVQNGDYKLFMLSGNKLTDFVIDFGRANDERMILSVQEGFQKKLSGLVKNMFKTCYLGISFSSSDVLTLHIREYDMMQNKEADTETVVELGQFRDVFRMVGK